MGPKDGSRIAAEDNFPILFKACVNPMVTVDFPSPDRKSTRLNSSHANISYAVFCLKKNIILVAAAAAEPPQNTSRSRRERIRFDHTQIDPTVFVVTHHGTDSWVSSLAIIGRQCSGF